MTTKASAVARAEPSTSTSVSGAAPADGFAERMQRVEELVQRIEQSQDASARGAAREMVATLLELHGAGLARLFELAGDTGRRDRPLVEACAEDELVGSLMLLHDLHPQSLEARVHQALESVRPYLQSHGGGVTLLGIDAGTVHLRLDGSCQGCPSSAATLQQMIERAIYESAPDVTAIEVDGEAATAPPSPLVQLQ